MKYICFSTTITKTDEKEIKATQSYEKLIKNIERATQLKSKIKITTENHTKSSFKILIYSNKNDKITKII